MRKFTKTGRQIHLAWVICLILFATVAVSCATWPGRKDPQAALTDQVNKCWNAKIKEDRKAVYRMTDAKFRQNVSMDDFVTRRKFSITGYRIHEIRMAEDNRSAHVIILFDGFLLGQQRKVSVGERWVLESGQWRLKLSDPINPFKKQNG